MKDLPLYDLNEIRQEKARRNFFDFVKFTKQDFIEGWFNRLVAEALQRFYEDVKAGKQPRLMIFAPPRSGKSELFSRRFPAWALGKDPDLQIIATSYSSDLSSRMNRDVQRIIDDSLYESVFPDTSLNSKNIVTVSGMSLRNSEIFEVVGKKGAYRSAGVGAGITGMGADIAIIDDPVKDAKEANSTTIRNAVWDWYTTTLYTRLSPNSGVLLGMTRWHEDDLAGRLINAMESEEGDKWEIIRFPAIAEQDEIYRKSGEPLHPERFDIDRLEKIKTAVGSHTWNALYQQRPTALGGTLFKGQWFKSYKLLPKIKRSIITVDTAQKTKEANDYSVFALWGEGVDGNAYLIDLLRGKWESPELIKHGRAFWAKHRGKHNLSGMHIEDKVSGTTLIQTLSRDVNPIIPVIPIQRNTDKVTRANDVSPFVESGHVYLPESAPFLSDFTSEVEKFPQGANDDQVDTMVDGLDLIFKPRNKGIWDSL